MPSDTPNAAVGAVLFDYGLVLTGPPHQPAWEKMKALLNADEASFHAAYWRPRNDYDRGVLGGEPYWQEVAGDVGHAPSPATLESLIDADNELWTQPNQPMIDWALALQFAGIRTGILSNLGDAMETGIRVRCPWLRGFDHMTFSHRLGTAKPDLTVYRHAAEGLGVPPEQILFVDDREDNVEGARKAGMQAIKYTNYAEFVAAMRAANLGYLLEPATKV